MNIIISHYNNYKELQKTLFKSVCLKGRNDIVCQLNSGTVRYIEEKFNWYFNIDAKAKRELIKEGYDFNFMGFTFRINESIKDGVINICLGE